MAATDLSPTSGAAAPDNGGPGRTTLHPRVVERLAVAAARETGATTRARDGLTGLVRGKLPRASATVAGQTSRVEVEVAASWPESLAGVATRVRDHVSRRITELSGIEVTAVDVTVADIVRTSDLTPTVHDGRSAS